MSAPRLLFPCFCLLASAVFVPACGPSSPDATSTGNPAAEAGEGAGAKSETTPPPVALTQEQLEELYVTSKQRWEATPQLPDASFAEIRADLMRVANEAEDPHLRANASLLLGGMLEDKNDQRAAISFYRQALELIPDDPAPHVVLALALAKAERWDEAIAAQWKVVELIPDELIGWLLLGEFHVKGGKLDEAAKVYGAYELRRKGLLDGLTLKQGGEYVKDEDERAACAVALAPAVDNGTALALLYALDSDTSAKVRAAVAGIMGEQRLRGYKELLTKALAKETDAEAKEAMTWALAEIERDGIDTAPGPVPDAIAKQVEAEAAALAAADADGTEAGADAGADAGPADAGEGEGEAEGEPAGGAAPSSPEPG